MKHIHKTQLSIALLLFGLLLSVLVKGVGTLMAQMKHDDPVAEEDNFITNSGSAEKIFYKDFGISIPYNFSVHGIDVSKHQQNINWKQVEDMRVKGIKISFVFIKASEGATRPDNSFQKNWREVEQTNLLRGAYHFFRPVKDPKVQADLFISQVKLKKGDLPPVVDVENSNRQSTDRICHNLQRFLDLLEDEYHVKPIIYSNLSFYTLHLAGKFNKYPIWIAYYLGDPFEMPDDRNWSFWQYSENGNVNGIRGKVDFNVFHGSLGQLKALCKK
ncbi:MAG: GH25 family lysozyme [Bacteroidota bacterium]|nr:GH25 family lysozyme [Bacteroidota bacterium]